MATKRMKRFAGEDGSMVGIPDQTEEEAANEAEMMSSMMRKRAMDEGERDEKALPAGYKVEPEAPAAKPRGVARSMQSGPGRSPTGASMSSGPGRKPTAPAPKKSAEEMRDEKVRNAYRAAGDDIKSAIRSAVTRDESPLVKGRFDASKLNRNTMMPEKPKFRASQGYAKGGSVSSASRRADGIATKGKTRGKMC